MAAARHDARDTHEREAREVRDAARIAVRIRVEVPRDCDGDLHDGVEAKLARSATVGRITDLDLGGVRPRLNDLSVDATARIRTAASPSALRADLESLVGVRAVTVLEDPR